jgi:hypothetical protein
VLYKQTSPLVLQAIELIRDPQRCQPLIIVPQLLLRYRQLLSPCILNKLQSSRKHEPALSPLVLPDCYVWELRPAVPAARSIPDLEASVGINFWVRCSTLDTVPIALSAVAKTYVAVPSAAIHFVYPDVTLDCKRILFWQDKEDCSVLLDILWVNQARASSWVHTQLLGEICRSHDGEEARHPRLLGFLVVALQRIWQVLHRPFVR